MRQYASTTEPHIRSSVIRGLQLPITEHDVDYGALLQDCRLNRADIDAQNGQIPLRKYLQFMETAAEQAKDPLLGIRLARSAGPASLGAIGFLFLSSRNLLEALSDFCKFMNLVQDITHVELRIENGEAVFKYELFSIADQRCRQDVEFSIALTARLIEMFAGPAAQLRRLHFRHSPWAPTTGYQRLLRVESRFNQEYNGIYMPESSLQATGRMSDAGLASILRSFLDEELREKDQIRSFADQIRHTILNSGLTPPVTADKAANHLGISKATLYRKLRREGLAFSALQDEVNYGIARSYLDDSELNVTQVAQILGFAESASFTRAFARWSGGETPSQYRRGDEDAA